MKFFAAQKLAKFASELLGAAGLDLSALASAGDITALKPLMGDSAQLAEANKALAAAIQEMQTLSVALENIETRHEQFVGALAKAGVKLPEFGETATSAEIDKGISDAVKARASVLAAEQLAGAGHPPVTETATDVTKVTAPKTNLTGMDRVRASISAGIAHLNPAK